MNKTLTLHLDPEIIKKAKQYAQNHQTTLSKLVEAYLIELIENDLEDIEITPLVKSLSGVVSIPKDFDPEKDYIQHVLKKHQ